MRAASFLADGCGYLTSPQVKRFWGGTCPDCRAGFSTPEHLAELRASIARAQEYFQAVDEARREASDDSFLG
jgi:hypothetical protein